jgi:uncharacterized membrane protein
VIGATPASRTLALGLSWAAVFWAAALLFAGTAPPRAVPAVVSGTVNAVSAVVCHRRPERSFHVHGRQFPVCARCTGLYLSGTLAALLAWLGSARMPRRTRHVIVLAAVPTLVTLAAEWSGASAVSNIARAIAALPLGAAAGWLFVRMLRAEAAPSTCAMIA